MLPPKSKTMDVNFTGALNAIKLGIHYFAKNPIPGGKVIVTGSQACFTDEDLPMYLASKYALRGVMRSLYSNAKKFNVAINMVAPSATETGMMPPGARPALEQMGFVFNDADAVGRAIAFLACGEKDENGEEQWNGKTIFVAGNTSGSSKTGSTPLGVSGWVKRGWTWRTKCERWASAPAKSGW